MLRWTVWNHVDGARGWLGDCNPVENAHITWKMVVGRAHFSFGMSIFWGKGSCFCFGLLFQTWHVPVKTPAKKVPATFNYTFSKGTMFKHQGEATVLWFPLVTSWHGSQKYCEVRLSSFAPEKTGGLDLKPQLPKCTGFWELVFRTKVLYIYIM